MGGESNNTNTQILSSWNWNLTHTSISFTYTNWYPGEPSNTGSAGPEKYLVFYSDFRWIDIVDQNACPVCEYKLMP